MSLTCHVSIGPGFMDHEIDLSSCFYTAHGHTLTTPQTPQAPHVKFSNIIISITYCPKRNKNEVMCTCVSCVVHNCQNHHHLGPCQTGFGDPTMDDDVLWYVAMLLCHYFTSVDFALVIYFLTDPCN